MPKSFPVGLRIHIPEPVEVKMVTVSIADRDAIDTFERFKGLWTYVVEEDTFFYLSGGTSNSHWKPFGGNNVTIEILDVFTGEREKIISGHGIKKYLQDHYVTKSRLQEVIEELTVADHVKNISQQDIQKWNENTGDKAFVHVQGLEKMTWVINHQLNKKPSVATFLPEGQRVYGDEGHLDNNISVVKFSKPIKGYATLN